MHNEPLTTQSEFLKSDNLDTIPCLDTNVFLHVIYHDIMVSLASLFWQKMVRNALLLVPKLYIDLDWSKMGQYDQMKSTVTYFYAGFNWSAIMRWYLANYWLIGDC